MTPGSPWIDARAAATPAQTALVADGARWSAAELAARAHAVAGRLRQLGIGPGDVLAVRHPRATVFTALLHAADVAGATLLPLNLRLTASEIAHQLGDARAGFLVDDEAPLAREAAAGAGVRAAPFDASWYDAAPLARAAPREPGDTLAIVYTSGTTGAPKGAELTRENFLWSAVASAFHLGVRPGDRWLASLPLFHVGGLSVLLRAVIQGTTALVHERFDATAVSRAIDRDGVTGISLTATTLARLLDARGERPAPATLRCALLGGGPCPAALIERAEKAGFPIAPTYGLTEAASQVATRRPGERGGLSPLFGTSLRVVDDDGRSLEAGAEGVIQVRGPTVMTGYRNAPEASASALRGGWLHTGDVGHLDARGELHVDGRRSDLIVSGGENVYPAEVESALLEHVAVSEAGVAGVADEEFGQRPAAWIVLSPGARLPGAAELERFCRGRLAGYKVPSAFRIVDTLPRTASGKLRRDELR